MSKRVGVVEYLVLRPATGTQGSKKVFRTVYQPKRGSRYVRTQHGPAYESALFPGTFIMPESTTKPASKKGVVVSVEIDGVSVFIGSVVETVDYVSIKTGRSGVNFLQCRVSQLADERKAL